MAKDIYHKAVIEALLKDGWIITHDPLVLKHKNLGAKLEIDLGLEKIIIADKESQKIAVEVKSFLKASMVSEFHSVLGQYLNYLVGLEVVGSDRILFIAIPLKTYEKLHKLGLFALSTKRFSVNIVVFDTDNNAIIEWVQQ
jgi:XisH protein